MDCWLDHFCYILTKKQSVSGIISLTIFLPIQRTREDSPPRLATGNAKKPSGMPRTSARTRVPNPRYSNEDFMPWSTVYSWTSYKEGDIWYNLIVVSWSLAVISWVTRRQRDQLPTLVRWYFDILVVKVFWVIKNNPHPQTVITRTLETLKKVI